MERDRTDLIEDTGVGVLALGASAGGQPAILTILRALPLDFDVPIVIVQHLPAESSTLAFYADRLPFTFRWVEPDARLAPRTVLLCPPRSCIELLPDGSFRLEPCAKGALDKQIDRLLRSVARSFSHRAIAAVLTGMGNDGAAGARELHDAGGCVVVQAASSAEFAEMPRSAISAGAADLVVPLGDMAQVLLDLVAGAVRPKAHSELDAIRIVFGTAGDVAAIARAMDWSRTALGPVLEWPAELRTIVRIGTESPHPSAVWWGAELVLIYNDAYRLFLGASKHPAALGVSARATWREIWNDIGPKAEGVLKDGVAVEEKDFCLHIDRHGFVEEIFVNFAFAPIRDTRGGVLGVHNTCWETTDKVVAERRLVALRALAACVAGASAPREVCACAAAALAAHPRDLPFGLLYLFDKSRRQASLAGAFGVAAGSAVAPHTVALVGVLDTWAMQRLLAGSGSLDDPGVLLEDLERRFPELASLVAAAPAGLAPRSVYVFPLRGSEDALPIGAFVAGLSPQRPFDDDYRSFVHFIAQQISAGIVEALARQRERERLDHLAELDRAKTEFFANVSHEFRTPLTLLLSPLEEMQRRRDALPFGLADDIDLAVRNSRRLLRLVDSLLDFSQIEQRRQRASIQPTDLASLTTDVASAFRSAIERAGLRLRVECPENLPLVPADRDMWEKIVSNLLSNALKFTFEGEIVVRLRAMSLHVELVVSDTGIGIPQHELPNIFKRFHRVRGARARTIEGSGIGLALVHDLVARMYGQLRVSSIEGEGTTFTVWMPRKSFVQTLAPDAAIDSATGGPGIAAGLAQEAETWLEPDANALALDVLGAPSGEHLRLAADARILVADDNADLRDYLRRLLGAYWTVKVVADGAEALAAARAEAFDLVLADVMMPNMDGFALLRAIREDEALKPIPVIFLTARAGEDTAIEGLLAGADDYLAKPFSARELIARVGGQIELARTRARAAAFNEFLVRFTDQIRTTTDPAEMARTACRLVHARLGVDRAYWSEVDWSTREWCTVGEWRVPDVVPISGRYALDAWEPGTSWLLRGDHYVVDDIQQDPRLPAAVKQACARLQLGASLALPVLVDGKLRSLLAVDTRTPRHWTAEEIVLLDAVASRCWAEVERARAETALRESEAKFRTVFESIDEGFLIHEVIFDDAGRAIDYRLLEINPAHTRMTGLPPETVGMLGSEFMPHVEQYWLELFGRVARTGVPERAEMHNQPTSRWYNVQVSRVAGFDNRIAIVFDDVTARKEAELALKASEERQAFHLRVADALRPLTDAASVEQATCQLLGEHLGVDRAYFVDIDEAAGLATVSRQYLREGAQSSIGTYRLADFGWALPPLRRGEMIVVDDVRQSELVPAADVAAMEAVQQAAVIAAPVVRGDGLVAVLCVTEPAPRKWRPAETELVREITERTWGAVERARVEAALRESEKQYRQLFERIDEGFCIIEVMFEGDTAVDYRFIEVNPTFERHTGIVNAPGRLMREIAPDHEQHWFDIYGQVALTGRPRRFEASAKALGDRRYAVNAFRVGEPEQRRVAIVFSDLTQPRRRLAASQANG